MRAKTTISQIAEKCKVSVSTVSIVLNNKPGVSDATRNQIIQMAEKMGYEIRSKPRQGSLPQGQLNTLGILVKTDSDVLPLPIRSIPRSSTAWTKPAKTWV